MFSLAGSLEKMLAGHTTSMFEYLASGRGGGGQAAAQAAAHAQATAKPGEQSSNANRGGQRNEGFKDMVY